MGKSSRRGIPSLSKVLNGTYIDFEGFGKHPQYNTPSPVLVGVYRKAAQGDFDAGFRQIVFNADYRGAAKDSGVSHQVEYRPERKKALLELLDDTGLSAPLFAFSEHELKVIEIECELSPKRRYKNVRQIAKRTLAASMRESDREKDWSLRAVCDAMGIPRPHKLETGGVTDRLKIVREHASSNVKWRCAPEAARQAWREVLLHNYDDVRLIYEIMLKLKSGSSPAGAGGG